MREALVFNATSNLDFHDVRSHVVRIPEVIDRIRQAQKIWDEISDAPFDLATFVSADDNLFLSHIRLKSFAAAIVQVGLTDRYLRRHHRPDFIVGAMNGDTAVKVATGEISFEDMVRTSSSLSHIYSRHSKPVMSSIETPVLAGIQLVEFAAYQKSERGYERIPMASRELEKMVADLVETKDVERVITIGPGHSLFSRQLRELTGRDVQMLESIELDPMLYWFWSMVQDDRGTAIAN